MSEYQTGDANRQQAFKELFGFMLNPKKYLKSKEEIRNEITGEIEYEWQNTDICKWLNSPKQKG